MSRSYGESLRRCAALGYSVQDKLGIRRTDTLSLSVAELENLLDASPQELKVQKAIISARAELARIRVARNKRLRPELY